VSSLKTGSLGGMVFPVLWENPLHVVQKKDRRVRGAAQKKKPRSLLERQVNFDHSRGSNREIKLIKDKKGIDSR